MEQTFWLKVKDSVLGGLASAFLAYGLHFPGTAVFVVLFIPLPLLILLVRYGFGWGSVGGAVSVAVVTFLAGPLDTLIWILGFLPIITCLGLVIRRRGSLNQAVFSGSLISFVLIYVLLIYSPRLFHADVVGSSLSQLRTWMESAIKTYQDNGGDAAKVGMARELCENTLEYIRITVPALLFSFTLTISWFNYSLVAKYLKRVDWFDGDFAPFTEWKVPDLWIWVFIVSFFLYFAASYLKVTFLTNLSVNLLTTFASIYFMMGMAIAAFFFQKWQRSFFWTVMLLVVIMLEPFLAILVAVLGAFDFWFDFRKLRVV